MLNLVLENRKNPDRLVEASARTGMSLVDLVVVLALAGLISALFLPLIQTTREAARKTLCEDRLAEIGVDVAAFHNTFCRLPMQLGSVGGTPWNDHTSASSPRYWGNQQYTSPLALAASVTTEFDVDPVLFDYEATLEEADILFFELDGWAELAATQPARYRCPSLRRLNGSAPTEGTMLAVQPIDFTGSNDIDNDYQSYLYDTNGRYGITNYVGCLGATSGGELHAYGLIWQFRGMMTSRELITEEHVSAADGLSNTFVFGENIGGIITTGRQPRVDYYHSWLSGSVVRGRGLTRFDEESTADAPLLGHGLKAAFNGFGSFHPNEVNFLYGDGSVHSIGRNIDKDTYYQLCGAFDTQ